MPGGDGPHVEAGSVKRVSKKPVLGHRSARDQVGLALPKGPAVQ